ncbi:carbohydrate sulfotransferase 15-like isoform X1 [Mytilus galloprovincialis]|uniref:carbohydrate sulfotransferase 15-like isoform X1 n=2 Tax=Mytilus galloprovincialis TaxID=29158 RepID=UPI003F7C9448
MTLSMRMQYHWNPIAVKLFRQLKNLYSTIVIFLIACILVTLTLDSLNRQKMFLDFNASSNIHSSRSNESHLWIDHQEKYCQNKRQNTKVEDILCMKPFQYLPNFKNPCWKDVNHVIKCLPYFMLIGMDKSGSSDLFDRLIKHPEIKGNIGSRGKETMWWSWKRYGLWLTRTIKRQNFNDYTSYFAVSAAQISNTTNDQGYHNLITGDGTPMDMWDFRGWPQIPQNMNKSEPEILTPHLIRHLYPEMKFIITLRNPIDRLYSDYFFLKLGRPTSAAFDVAVNSSLQILNECNRVNSLRKCLYDAKQHYKWDIKARIHLGFYYVYLLEWFKVFPRDQFIILRTEDYSTDVFHHMSELHKFLGAGDLSMKQMNDLGILSKEHVYETKAKQKVAPMSNVTREKLLNLYTPFNNELAVLLNDSRFRW